MFHGILSRFTSQAPAQQVSVVNEPKLEVKQQDVKLDAEASPKPGLTRAFAKHATGLTTGFLANTYAPSLAQRAAYNLTYAIAKPTNIFARAVTNIAANNAGNIAFKYAAANAWWAGGLAGAAAFTAADYGVRRAIHGYSNNQWQKQIAVEGEKDKGGFSFDTPTLSNSVNGFIPFAKQEQELEDFAL